MKLKPGDKVKFLDDTGEGTLVRFLDDQTAEVLIEDGFLVPVLISEIIPAGTGEQMMYHSEATDPIEDDSPGDRSALYNEEEKTRGKKPPREYEDVEDERETVSLAGSLPKEESLTLADASFPPKVFMALVNEPAGKYSFFLVNDSSFYLYYTVSIRTGNFYSNIHSGRLEPDMKVFLMSRSPMFLEKQHEIYAQAILYHPEAIIPEVLPLNLSWKPVNARGLFAGAPTENEYFDSTAVFYPFIVASGVRKPVKMTLEEFREQTVKGIDEQVRAAAKKDEKGRVEEVDLHIEQLVNDHEKLDAAQILEIQLARFTTALDGAIRHKTKKVVFIHGVGNQKLRHEIRKMIETTYPKLKYQDASFREYGYGATMVIFP